MNKISKSANQTTLFRKNLMALTGLFLCLFLVVHLAGNLQLLLPPEEASAQFNLYSKFMTGNPLIKMVSYLLYASIIAHVVFALIITLKNRQAANSIYVYDLRGKASNWYSRNMGALGSIILLFLIVHMKDFWYEYKFGSLPLDSEGNKDLYTIVINSFSELWYVALYTVSFIALGYHLLHGFNSAFKTLGAYPRKLSRILYYLSIGLTCILTLGFIIIPIVVYFKYHLT
ncbi:MAG: succinate dehydrogenase cytochrome b subunit [Bacteroidota bacterium]